MTTMTMENIHWSLMIVPQIIPQSIEELEEKIVPNSTAGFLD